MCLLLKHRWPSGFVMDSLKANGEGRRKIVTCILKEEYFQTLEVWDCEIHWALRQYIFLLETGRGGFKTLLLWSILKLLWRGFPNTAPHPGPPCLITYLLGWTFPEIGGGEYQPPLLDPFSFQGCMPWDLFKQISIFFHQNFLLMG